jgi:hypothetical protein
LFFADRIFCGEPVPTSPEIALIGRRRDLSIGFDHLDLIISSTATIADPNASVLGAISLAGRPR